MSERADGRVTCGVCPHECRIPEGGWGFCGARTVVGGVVKSASYGRTTALALDPIEKKPLAHFHSGAYILSYGSFGCTMRCPFCQNSEIAAPSSAPSGQERATGEGGGCDTGRAAPFARFLDRAPYLAPDGLVTRALARRAEGGIGIALTYNEPFAAPEYLMDVARRAREAGLATAAVTNGYVSPEVWDAALPLVDAMNIDLKCYSEEGYRALGAPGGLPAVKRSIAAALEAGVHVEVTTLVVPGFSDDEERFAAECDWLASLDRALPLHLTRFFPAHRMADAAPTSLSTLRRLERIARARLDRVRLGNV